MFSLINSINCLSQNDKLLQWYVYVLYSITILNRFWQAIVQSTYRVFLLVVSLVLCLLKSNFIYMTGMYFEIHLSRIWNECLTNGTFSNTFKSTAVIFHIKKMTINIFVLFLVQLCEYWYVWLATHLSIQFDTHAIVINTFCFNRLRMGHKGD